MMYFSVHDRKMSMNDVFLAESVVRHVKSCMVRILLLILLNNSLRSMGVVSIAVVCINMYASINAFQTLWTRRVHNLFY